MSINWSSLNERAAEFNVLYNTTFNYNSFYTKLTTMGHLDPKKAPNIVYRGALGKVLKDALVHACYNQRNAQNGATAVDLMDVVKNFEEYLMQPFVKECKAAGEKRYPKRYGGMNKMQMIDLVEHVVSVSPKNDVELTEQAYLSGNIRLRDIRENVNDMPFAVGRGFDNHQIRRIATFMLAIENVNKARPLWWRIIHPFRNNAEQRDAREYRTILRSCCGNNLEFATSLALEEYKTVEVTKESINALRTSLEEENNKNLLDDSARAHLEIKLENNVKTDVIGKINEVKKNDPVITRTHN